MSEENQGANINIGQIVENEFKIRVLEHTVDLLLKNMSPFDRPNQSVIEGIREKVVKELNQKYPGADLKYQCQDV